MPRPIKPSPGLSQAAFARVMGVDRSQVTRWAQRGMPLLPDGTVPPEEGADWVRSRVDTYKIRGSIGARQLSTAETKRYQDAVVVAHSAGNDCAAVEAARLLLPLLPEATVRTVVADLWRRLQHGSVECLADELIPPAGVRTWADDPRLSTPAPTEHEWQEMLEELARSRAEAA